MSEIIRILMRRDGMTKQEAKQELDYVMEMVYDAIDNGEFEEAEEIFMDNLGLESDYLEMAIF